MNVDVKRACSLSLFFFGRGMGGPGRGHVGTSQLSAMGDTVMIDYHDRINKSNSPDASSVLYV